MTKIRSKTPRQLQRMNRLYKVLMQTIGLRGIFPLKTIADYINNPAQNPPVIHARHTMRQRKIRSDFLHLLRGKQKHVTHRPPTGQKVSTRGKSEATGFCVGCNLFPKYGMSITSGTD